MAHHSFTMFDIGKCETIEGTVRNYQWTFPHTWIWLFVPNSEGTQDIWGFEGEPPSNLAQDGWTSTSLKKGEKVKLTYSPLKDGRQGGAFSIVEFADGTKLLGPRGHADICVQEQ